MCLVRLGDIDTLYELSSQKSKSQVKFKAFSLQSVKVGLWLTIKSNMTVSDSPWQSVKVCESLRQSMTVHGSLWKSMIIHDSQIMTVSHFWLVLSPLSTPSLYSLSSLGTWHSWSLILVYFIYIYALIQCCSTPAININTVQ